MVARVDDVAVVCRKSGLSAHQMQWQALCDTRDDWRLANAEVYHLVWVELIAVNVAEVDVSGESHAVAGRQKLVCQLGCSVRQPIVADSLHEVTRAEAEAEGRDGGWPAVNHGIERELDFGRVMRVGAEQRYRVLCRTSGRHPALPVHGADRKFACYMWKEIVGFHDATRLATLHNSAMPYLSDQGRSLAVSEPIDR